MKWKHIRGNWEQFRTKVKEKWPIISDDDLSAIDGKRDQLFDLLRVRYGMGQARARKEVDELARKIKML
jgi:uncharacterized protein YjbJ (UPF0337 family)